MKQAIIKATVHAVCRKSDPGIPKIQQASILLREGFGVEGDYHAGKTVRHRYLAKKDPDRENIRQVLLIDRQILNALGGKGITIQPGEMGENIILEGIDLMSLPIGSHLRIGEALLELSEIRDPCHQLNFSHPDVLKSVVSPRGEDLEYKAGVFARILEGGRVAPGDPVKLMRAPDAG